MKKKFLILLIVFFGCLYNLSAYINIPPSPDSISNENFTYNVSYKTTDLGNYFFGIIKIESNTEPKYYFTVPIYVIRINEYLEGDVQWVFIKNIEFKNSKMITIINRANDIFEFNINTYEVKCITKRSRVFDFDINSFNLICDPSGTDSIVKDLYEIDLDEEKGVIEVKRFAQDKEIIKISDLTLSSNLAHGGGDYMLIENLYDAITTGHNTTTLDESIESHLMAILAEKSRLQNGKVMNVHKK